MAMLAGGFGYYDINTRQEGYQTSACTVMFQNNESGRRNQSIPGRGGQGTVQGVVAPDTEDYGRRRI